MNAMPTDPLPELNGSHEDVHADARALLARGNHLQQAQADGSLLELRAGIVDRAPAASPGVSLGGTGGHLLLVLEHEQGANPLGDLDWRDYEGDARLLAWTLAHENLIQALAPLFGGSLLPLAFESPTSRAAGDSPLWLELHYRDPAGGSQRGWLGLPGAALRQLGAAAGWKQEPGRLATIGEVTALTLNLIVPGRLLDAAAIANLVPGDVLMLGAAGDCEGRLQPDRETSRDVFGLPDGWTVRWQQGQWLVIGKPVLGGSIEPTRPQFLLTSLSLALGELAALKPGSVAIHESALLGRTVGIVLHGRRFGEGVLVGLGEWLGVRILHQEASYGSR